MIMRHLKVAHLTWLDWFNGGPWSSKRQRKSCFLIISDWFCSHLPKTSLLLPAVGSWLPPHSANTSTKSPLPKHAKAGVVQCEVPMKLKVDFKYLFTSGWVWLLLLLQMWRKEPQNKKYTCGGDTGLERHHGTFLLSSSLPGGTRLSGAGGAVTLEPREGTRWLHGCARTAKCLCVWSHSATAVPSGTVWSVELRGWTLL